MLGAALYHTFCLTKSFPPLFSDGEGPGDWRTDDAHEGTSSEQGAKATKGQQGGVRQRQEG